MLRLPDQKDNTIRTIGIDPGTMFLGLSVMEINLDDLTISNTYAFTLKGEKLSNSPILFENYGAKFSRISGMMYQITRVLDIVSPTIVTSESPFFNPTRPAAFEALIEVISQLRNTLFNYDPQIKLQLVDPSSVKNAVGAKGGANKVTIKEALLKLDTIYYRGDVNMDLLDDNSIDSIAVNYWYYLRHILRQ